MRLGLQLYFSSYLDLTADRQSGMAVGRIPWGATEYYGLAMELEEEQMEDLHYHVQQMDNEYMSWKETKGAKSG